MDAGEFKAIDAQLEAMSKRCDAVIARERPIQPDRSYGRKRLKPDYEPPRPVPVVAPVAHRQEPEVRYIPARRGTRRREYVAPSEDQDIGCGSIEQVFAAFERDFDKMAQAHRG